MLDLARLRRIKLSGNPFVQKFVAVTVLTPNYLLPPRVRISLEGREHLPDHPVIFAMNHTDRYNYWPFQYRLWRDIRRYTATWVKGKYYENAFLGGFMERVNSLPTVSRGYLITHDFVATVGRRPRDEEYAALRQWIDAASSAPGAAPPPGIPAVLLTTRRDVLGRLFDPDREDYAACINGLFQQMMSHFIVLHREAFDLGLDLLVFPEGTRSLRLSRGRIGLAQIALKFGKTIVPVGCSGSDKVYPGNSPIARGGRITYRLGAPLTFDGDLAPFHIPGEFTPFTPEAERDHRERFEGATALVMDRINELVDPPYRRAAPSDETAVQGSARFV